MTVRGRRFRLGLFVVGAGAMFIGLLAFVLDNTLRSAQATYHIMFEENVKGMVIGSRVNFQGVPVGVVSDMRFQDGKTLVELNVDPTRSTIQRVTKARMDRLLVTGQVTIELEGYSKDSEPLPEGAFIEVTEDPMSSLRGSVPELVDEAVKVLIRLEGLLESAEVLLGADNRQSIAAILDNLEGVTADLRHRTLPGVDALVAEGRAAAADVRGATASIRAAADEGTLAIGEARAAIAALERLEPAIHGLLTEAGELVGSVETFAVGLQAPTMTTLQALRQTLADVRSLARQLELAPNSLLWGRTKPAAPFGGGR